MKTRIQEHRDRMWPAFFLAMMALFFGVLLLALMWQMAKAADLRVLALVLPSVVTWHACLCGIRSFQRHAAEVERLTSYQEAGD
jgi:hypothetical protein